MRAPVPPCSCPYKELQAGKCRSQQRTRDPEARIDFRWRAGRVCRFGVAPLRKQAIPSTSDGRTSRIWNGLSRSARGAQAPDCPSRHGCRSAQGRGLNRWWLCHGRRARRRRRPSPVQSRHRPLGDGRPGMVERLALLRAAGGGTRSACARGELGERTPSPCGLLEYPACDRARGKSKDNLPAVVCKGASFPKRGRRAASMRGEWQPVATAGLRR